MPTATSSDNKQEQDAETAIPRWLKCGQSTLTHRDKITLSTVPLI